MIQISSPIKIHIANESRICHMSKENNMIEDPNNIVKMCFTTIKCLIWGMAMCGMTTLSGKTNLDHVWIKNI
jgi:hypothetical protein